MSRDRTDRRQGRPALSSTRIASPGTPCRSRRRGPRPPRSSGRRPPCRRSRRGTARAPRDRARPRDRGGPRTPAMAGRRTAPRPSTTIASAGALVVALALRPDAVASHSPRRWRCRGRPARPHPAGRAPSNAVSSGDANGSHALRQRPWHFLYLAPEPHQHGSLRPIRAPLGVKPGFGPPPADGAAARRPRRAGRRATRAWRRAVAGAARAAAQDRRAAGGRGCRRLGPLPIPPPAAVAPFEPLPPLERRRAPAIAAATAGSSPSGEGAGWRVTVTRKIEEATPWRMRLAQLLVQLERLALELVERVLLGVAAQADAAAHVVELGEVLDPERVDRPESTSRSTVAQSSSPTSAALRGRASRRPARGGARDRLAAAELPELVLASSPRPSRPIAVRAADNALQVPVVGVLADEMARRRASRSRRRGSPGPSRSGPRCGGPCRARRRSSRAAC